jgi:hypothetical protein
LHIFENDDVADEENFRLFIDTPVNVPRLILMMLSSHPLDAIDDVVLSLSPDVVEE